jgi:hypothetical protein
VIDGDHTRVLYEIGIISLRSQFEVLGRLVLTHESPFEYRVAQSGTQSVTKWCEIFCEFLGSFGQACFALEKSKDEGSILFAYFFYPVELLGSAWVRIFLHDVVEQYPCMVRCDVIGTLSTIPCPVRQQIIVGLGRGHAVGGNCRTTPCSGSRQQMRGH